MINGARGIPFGTGWLFGPAAEGSGLARVRRQRVRGGDAAAHGGGAVLAELGPGRLGAGVGVPQALRRAAARAAMMRVFLDFGAAMTHSTVTLNGTEVADLPGRLPAVQLPRSPARCGRPGTCWRCGWTPRFNLDVPPDRPAPQVSTSVDFWQPGGIYRDVRLRVVPQVFLADVFAKPVNVLDAAARQVVVQVTVDAAVVPAGTAEVAVALRRR